SEHDVLTTVAAVASHLSEAGFDVSTLGVVNDPAALLAGLRERQPGVIFNLFEGTGDRASTEPYVAGLLGWLRVPFTRSAAQTLSLADAKHLTKHLFQSAGLLTPAFFVTNSTPVASCPLGWPVIVKPAREHASVGLDQGSVVTNVEQLNARIGRLLDRYEGP